MTILGIETSGDISSLALADEAGVLGELSFPSRQELSRTLIGRVDEVMRRADLDLRQLSAIAVSLGPGSFTSLRIGVVTAKALAHACRLAIVGVPTAEAIAAGTGPEPGLNVVVVTRARADEVYAAVLRARGDGGFDELQPCRVMTAADAQELTAAIEPPASVCRDAPAHARDVARLGLLKLRRHGPDDAFAIKPIYVRPSQAEAMREQHDSVGPPDRGEPDG